MKTSPTVASDGSSSHDPEGVNGLFRQEESKAPLNGIVYAANASSADETLGNACNSNTTAGSSSVDPHTNFFSALTATPPGWCGGHSDTSTLGETTSLRAASHATCGSPFHSAQQRESLPLQGYNLNNKNNYNNNNFNTNENNSPTYSMDASAKPSGASSLTTRMPQAADLCPSLPARLLLRNAERSIGGGGSEEQSVGAGMDFSSPGDQRTPPILCCTLEKNYSFQGSGGDPSAVENTSELKAESTDIFMEKPPPQGVMSTPPPQEGHAATKIFSNSQLPSKNGSFFNKFLSAELLEPPHEQKLQQQALAECSVTNATPLSVARSDTTDSSRQCNSYYALYHLVNHHDNHNDVGGAACGEDVERKGEHPQQPHHHTHAQPSEELTGSPNRPQEDDTDPLSPNTKEMVQEAGFLKEEEAERLRDFLRENSNNNTSPRLAPSMKSDTPSSISSKVPPVMRKAVSCGSIGSDNTKRQEELTMSQRKCTSLTTSQSLHSLVGTRTNMSDCTTTDRSGILMTRYGAIISSRMRDAEESGEHQRGSSSTGGKPHTLSMTTLQTHVDQVGTMEAEERIRRYEKPMLSRHTRKNKSATALDEVLNQCDFLSLKDVVAAVKYTAPEEVNEAYAHVSNCQRSDGLNSSRMATSTTQSHPDEHHHQGSPQMDPGYMLDPQNAVSLAAAMTEVSLHRDSMGSSAPALKPQSTESTAAWKAGYSVNSTPTSVVRAMLTAPHHSCCLSSTSTSLEAASKPSPTTASGSNQANGPTGASISCSQPPLFDPLEHKVCDWTVADKDGDNLLQPAREMQLAPVQPNMWHAFRTAGAGSQPGRTPPICSCPSASSPAGSLPTNSCMLRSKSFAFSNGVSGEDMLRAEVVIDDIHCSGFTNELDDVKALQKWATVVYEADKVTSQTEVST